MRDVARATNVSIQTVSSVINDKPGITQETRQRVLAAIEALGYRPYRVAQSLRTRATQTIALIVSDITNPFFATVASIAEDIAHAHGYSLVLYNTHYDAQREATYFQAVLDRWIDGLLFVGTFDQLNGLDRVQQAGVPVVALDRIPAGYEGPSITLDNTRAGQLVAEHLLALGHTRLAHISGPPGLRLARERERSFVDTVRARGLEPAPSVAGDEHWSTASGFAAMTRLLADGTRPTAIFAANDQMAIGAIAAAFQSGLRVPDDLSVVGVDDIELASFHHPPLTTVAQPIQDLAREAVRLLLEGLQGAVSGSTQIVLKPTLIVRGSTCACS